MCIRMHIRRSAIAAIRRLSNILIAAGCAAMASSVWIHAGAAIYQALHIHEFPETLPLVHKVPNGVVIQAPADVPLPAPLARVRLTISPRDSAIARLTIPRVGIDTVVKEGVDAATLRVAAGHMPGSALPGSTGNLVLTAHRDTFFRPLRLIEIGDEIVTITRSGRFRYRVYSVLVTSPSFTEVLRPTKEAECTLITCFPFDYIGPSPRRFVVRARMMNDR